MRCPICQRETPNDYITEHHLIPACKKGKETISLCIDCHGQVHLLFTNNELRDYYNTSERLLKNERVQKWIRFIRKKKTFGTCMKIKKSKR